MDLSVLDNLLLGLSGTFCLYARLNLRTILRLKQHPQSAQTTLPYLQLNQSNYLIELNRSLTYDDTDPCGSSLSGNHCEECEKMYASTVDIRRVKR